MIVRSISIRSKLQLTTLVVVLLLTLLALIYMDATKKNSRATELLQERSERKSNLQLGLSLVLGILLITTYLVFFALNLSGSFRKLSLFTRELHKGKLPPPFD